MSPSRKPDDANASAEFKEALRDVTPLPGSNRIHLAKEPPSPIPRQTIKDEVAALEESRGDDAASSFWQGGVENEEEQTFLRTGLSPDVLRKLRRGYWVIQAELDLHGHTVEQARLALNDFLADVRGSGKRCVKVIHGKGLSSPNREPVLKSRVRRWLTQRDAVIAYCEAPAVSGGSGAVLVLIRGRR